MEKYHIKEETPLNFHKFFRYSIIPLSVVFASAQIIYQMINANARGSFYMMDIVFNSLLVILACICFFGYFSWLPKAWYCTMAILALRPLYALILVIIEAVNVNHLGAFIGQLIGTLVFSALVSIYYIKRKPLFFDTPDPIQNDSRVQFDKSEQETEIQRFCYGCGKPLELNSDGFCVYCGAEAKPDVEL